MAQEQAARAAVLVAGEALIDIVVPPRGETVEHVGGSPANVAVGLARLGHRVELATHVANDPHGRRIVAHLEERHVHLTPGSDTGARTTTATAYLDAAGGATYDFDLLWELPDVDLTGVDHLHTGSIAATQEPGGSLVLALMSRAREHATVSYDPNLRPTVMGRPHDVRSRIEECLGMADVVKASSEDIEWLYAGAPVDDVAHLWGLLGPSLVIVTRGGEGTLVSLPAAETTTEVPAQPAQVVDTVGAGDSFMAGLVSGLLDTGLLGGPAGRQRLRAADAPAVLPAVERALACARWTVQRAGAAAPTRDDLAPLAR